jgi:hypothetical protein
MKKREIEKIFRKLDLKVRTTGHNYRWLVKEAKDVAAVEIKKILNLVPELLEIPYSRIWTAYDKETDVLYINFKKPSHADDSELTDDDIIIRYEKREMVGVTRVLSVR